MGNNIVDHSDVVGATPVGAAPTTQSGTKPNLVAKILATKFGVFFVIYNVFQKIYVHYEFDDNVIKYHGSVIPHDWDVNFQKFGGLPTVVAFWEN